jgi:preprotein translocase subunit SecA
MPVEFRVLDKAIESAQSRVEGFNFDIRKHTVEFDDVMNTQRKIIYADRQTILDGEDMHERVLEMIGEEVAALIDMHLPPEEEDLWDLDALLRAARSMNPLLPEDLTAASLSGKSRDEIEDHLIELVEAAYQEREEAIGTDNMRYVERRMMLGAIDRQWVDYLTAMDELRQTINLQAYAQRDPLVEFKRHSFDMFEELKDNITHDIVYQILPSTFQYEDYLRRIREEQERRLAAAQRADSGSAGTTRATRTVRKEVKMPGRNDPCPCGSGRKFKQCHLGREEEIMPLLQAGGSAPTLSAQLATGTASQRATGGKAQEVKQEAAEIATATVEEAQQADERPQTQQADERPQQSKPTPRGRAAPPAQSSGNGKGGGKKKNKGRQPAKKR